MEVFGSSGAGGDGSGLGSRLIIYEKDLARAAVNVFFQRIWLSSCSGFLHTDGAAGRKAFAAYEDYVKKLKAEGRFARFCTEWI